jgi:hypothetical protein
VSAFNRRNLLRTVRAAAGGLLLLAVFGCADVSSGQPQVQQIGQMLWQAYHATTSLPSVRADVNLTVVSGVDPIASAEGSYALWFGAQSAQANLMLSGPSPTRNLYTVRDKDEFYSGTAISKLAGGRQDLAQLARLHPAQLPQIESPGFDPFQLNVLLGALQWPDTISSLGPVVIDNSSGQSTEYQLRINTAALARHESAVDDAWLRVMAKEPGGSPVTLEVSVNDGKISAVTASFPVPSAPVPTPRTGKGAKISPGSLQTPPPASVVITETFDYSAHVLPVSRPS